MNNMRYFPDKKIEETLFERFNKLSNDAKVAVGCLTVGAATLACIGALALGGVFTPRKPQSSTPTQVLVVEDSQQVQQVTPTIEMNKTQEVEQEIQLVTANPERVITINRMKGDFSKDQVGGDCVSNDYVRSICDDVVYGKYEVTNNTSFIVLELWSQDCEIYNIDIQPGETVPVYCLEYRFSEYDGWKETPPCINIYGKVDTTKCVSSSEIPKQTRLSDLVQIDIQRKPSGAPWYSIVSDIDRLEYSVKVDADLRSFVALDPNVEDPPEGYRWWGLYEVGTDKELRRFMPSQSYLLWSPILKGDDIKQKCFGLSAPYFESEVVCIRIPQP